MSKRKQGSLGVILSVVFMLILAGWAERVHSQEKYPTRAIDIIAPFSPGGASDVSARQIANYLKKKWNVPVNIVSKPGGRGIPALVEFYQSPPDGYTMLADAAGSSSNLAAATATTKDLPFDVMNRTFVALVSANPFVIFIPSTSPFKTLKEFLVAAKKSPENISYTAGPTALEYAMRQFFSATGVDISRAKAVMCKGASDAVLLVAGGHVAIGAAALGTTLPSVKAQTIRPLLISSKNRSSKLPDLPTSAELGYPGIDTVQWNGISGPPKLPSSICDIWAKALQEMVGDPGFLSHVENSGGIPFYHNPQATAEFVKKETEEAIKLFR